MFAQVYSSLMTHCRLSTMQIPPAGGAHRTRIEADAQSALRRESRSMPLSQRLNHPSQWLTLQKERRQSLLALILAGYSPAVMAAAVDLIAEISEESTWSENARGLTFDDPSHPSIDFQCAETAMLFAWTALLLHDHLEGCVLARMYSEVQRRLFKPVAAYDDYDFMTADCPYPMTIACDVLLSALLLESDEARQARVVRSALTCLDESCARHGRRLIPMEECVMEITSITDLVNLLCDLTSRRVDLTARVPAGDWLDEILFPWIQDDFFNNPAGDSMRPAVSGSDIFRIGEAVKDGPLSALGAMLYHRNHLPSPSVTGRILEGTTCDALERTFAKPQPMRCTALRNNLLMTAQIPGLYCSMHVGGGRANAGDLCIFADGRPILMDGGRSCCVRNLPVIAGLSQTPCPERPCIADFEVLDDRETMTVDLTCAYPDACTLRSYQRTALTMRTEGAVRLVDALDMERPGIIQFRFLTVAEPDLEKMGAVLGPLRMTWETDFSIRVSSVTGGLYCLELQTPEPVRQGLFSFNFERI